MLHLFIASHWFFFLCYFYFLLLCVLKLFTYLEYSWLTILLVSGVQHSDSVYIYIFLCRFFSHRLLQNIDYNFLCYTWVPCYLFSNWSIAISVSFFKFFNFFFFLFRATPVAYGGSQARDLIGAPAAGLRHSNARSRHVCDLHHSWPQHWIFNPLREARDRICNLMVPSRIRFCCASTGSPFFFPPSH